MPNIERLMEKLSRARDVVSLREVEQVLRSHRYVLEKVEGSHFHYVGPGGTYAHFPVHNKKVKACYVRDIIKELKGNEKK